MNEIGTRVPGGLITPAGLRRLVEAGEVETVMLALADMRGRVVGKRHHAPGFVEQLLSGGGAEACAYLLASDVQMRPVQGFDLASWASGYGDLRLVPNLRTLRRMPWPGGGVLVLADAEQTDGRPVAVAPRQVLYEQVAALAELGVSAKVGLETEFTVYRGVGDEALGRLQPLSARNLDYALVHPPRVREYVHELEQVLVGAGLPLEAMKTEAAPGQIEATFRYGDALSVADDHVVFKHIVKTVTPWTDSTATFMAAPDTGIGNGMHIHVSLWEKDQPVFPAEGGGLSAAGAQAVAGLLYLLPDALPLLLPTPNSYKRLRPESFAPTRVSWGWDNRTTAVRVTGHGSGLHLEVRIPGADANPYLAVAAVLAACRRGIAQETQPPPAVTGNAYRQGDLPPLPADLPTSASAFQDSAAWADLLGKEVVSHYATAARIECDVAASEVTDVERLRGFHDA
jgi:glutamine synthetase